MYYLQMTLVLAQAAKLQHHKNRNANHLLSLAYAQANLSKFEEATKNLKLLINVAPPDSKFRKEVEAALVKTKANQPIRNVIWR